MAGGGERLQSQEEVASGTPSLQLTLEANTHSTPCVDRWSTPSQIHAQNNQHLERHNLKSLAIYRKTFDLKNKVLQRSEANK